MRRRALHLADDRHFLRDARHQQPIAVLQHDVLLRARRCAVIDAVEIDDQASDGLGVAQIREQLTGRRSSACAASLPVSCAVISENCARSDCMRVASVSICLRSRSFSSSRVNTAPCDEGEIGHAAGALP